MFRSLWTAMLPALVAIAWSACGTSQAKAQDFCRAWHPDLFYNYYVPGNPCGGVGGVPAQLYISPRPTPAFVGHTYITYQPLMPHEFLYHHCRWYFKPNGEGSGLTTTKVCWW